MYPVPCGDTPGKQIHTKCYLHCSLNCWKVLKACGVEQWIKTEQNGRELLETVLLCTEKRVSVIAVIFKFCQQAESKLPVSFKWMMEYLMISPLMAFVSLDVNNAKSTSQCVRWHLIFVCVWQMAILRHEGRVHSVVIVLCPGKSQDEVWWSCSISDLSLALS